MSKENNKYIVPIGLAIAGYFLVLDPILVKLGIVTDPRDTAIDQEKLKQGSPFDPNYWKTKVLAQTIPNNVVDGYIDTIVDSFGIFSDNYSAILGVFKSLLFKTQVSYLADKFYQSEGVDLLEFLKNGGGLMPWDGLSTAHLTELITYANSLK